MSVYTIKTCLGEEVVYERATESVPPLTPLDNEEVEERVDRQMLQ